MAHEQLRSSTIGVPSQMLSKTSQRSLKKRLSSRGRNFPLIFRQNCMADCG